MKRERKPDRTHRAGPALLASMVEEWSPEPRDAGACWGPEQAGAQALPWDLQPRGPLVSAQ